MKFIKMALRITIVLALCLFFYQMAQGAEKSVYTIQPGDTLSGIAQKVYGDESRWKDIWAMNPYIKNPDLIYPGQVLNLDKDFKITKVEKVKPKPLTSDEFYDMAVKLMFKTNRLPIKEEGELRELVQFGVKIIGDLSEQGRYAEIRDVAYSNLIPNTRSLETYALARAITEIYKVYKEDGCLLLAMAWQETQFYNRRGKSDERGFFQFLPSTVRGLYPANSSYVLGMLENDPDYATRMAWWYIDALRKEHGSLEKALLRYNGHIDYVGRVMRKLNKIKKEAKL